MTAPIAGFLGLEETLGGRAETLYPTNLRERDSVDWCGWLGYWRRHEQPPVHDLAHSLWVVHEGTIQNHRELTAKLTAAGFPPQEETPGKLLLRAYQAWGERMPEAIEGTCAFLLWDAKKQRLLAARDRAGMQRLYLAQANDAVVAATDIRALLELREQGFAPDPRALAFTLTLGYVPAGLSIWQGAICIGPGQCAVWTPATGMEVHSYWEPPRAPQEERSLPWKDVFESAMADVVASDEAVGLLLSGGLDSSSIALALHRLGRQVTGLSFYAPEVPDESHLAMELAKHLGLPTVGPLHIPTQDVNGLVDEVVAVMQEPQCHPAVLTSYVMSRAASPYFKVLLTGDGAEETLGGYAWYDAQDGTYKNWRLAASLRRLARSILYPQEANAEYNKLVEQFTRTSALHRHAWHVRKAMFLPAELRTLLGPRAGEFTEEDMLAPLRAHYAPTLPYRRSLQRLDMMTFCADALLPKIRRIGAAHGVEVRLPFLDRRVIDWAIAYPFEKRERKHRKPVLRDYLTGHVPEAILSLPKHGFNPLWLDALDWKRSVNEIRTGYWVKEGYLSPAFEEFIKAGAPCWKQRLWSLVVLTRWASIWLK